ncbi:MAG TPA: VCBS repeat-containing protein, partial [Polyangiaceae bacterium]
ITETWTETQFPLSGSGNLAVGDINGDKLDDVFATTSEYGAQTVNRLTTWLGSRSALLEQKAVFTLAASGQAMRVADLDRDGYNDLFVATSAGYVAFRGDTLASMVTLSSGNERMDFQPLYQGPDGLLFDDVDHDGILDIIATADDKGTGLQRNAGVALWRGLGDGHFIRTESYLVPGANSAVGLDDFDDDGIGDLLLSGGSPYGGSLMLLRGAARCR